MGVGSIQHFNYAMLVKWWWRFKAEPNQLWAQVVASIHCGYNINSPAPLFPLKRSIPGVWKDVGSMEVALRKAGIFISDYLVEVDGVWKWRSDPFGSFSVKQVRADIESAAVEAGDSDLVFEWNNWVTPKANYLLWRALLGKVASKVGLVHRGIALADSVCSRCGIAEEDPDHIFINCLWSRCIWWNIMAWIRIKFPLDVSNLKDLFSYIKSNPGGRVWKRCVNLIASATVWCIWKARNKKVFEGVFIPVSSVVDQIKEESFGWACSRSSLRRPVWGNWKSFDVIGLL
ncbi:putative reverse transcriptase zinc-binding domain-containing protein [Helianthus annuus]|uniref:Reverse transcriptase zinc-binding domain-containing protein n=1 Tax=Helianthus annuus TaxID=4232 RepID=A0A9K3J7Z8_HELAN|nr:putative reverse transcriptase zinc-binding domain-containing protein [Helianthus annuus]KAJ0589272.1 putative reverse transcriptase zinc-binding domain-containing protein [Helianthus annuus]KAJ0931644.1 putative reverse transcriptase zinc-binding domain-containing protein [Helianthus annuus]